MREIRFDIITCFKSSILLLFFKKKYNAFRDYKCGKIDFENVGETALIPNMLIY